LILVRAILQVVLVVIFLLVLGYAAEARREATPAGTAGTLAALGMLAMMFAGTFAIGDPKRTRFIRVHGASPAVVGWMFVLGCLVAMGVAGFVAFGGTLGVYESGGGNRRVGQICFAKFVQAAGAWWPATMVAIVGLAAGVRGTQILAHWKPRLRVRQLITAGLAAPSVLILLPMVLLC
jgi:hypothetical protein